MGQKKEVLVSIFIVTPIRISYKGKPAVMMVGGGAVKNSTEIYVIEENRWVMGPAFPRGFLQGGYVNLDDGSFIIAGGYDVDNRSGGH